MSRTITLPDNLIGKVVPSLRKEQDYHNLIQRFGVRPSNAEFWWHIDRVHRLMRKDYPVEYGLHH